MEVETTLLRYAVAYYGHIGNKLRALSLQDYGSIVQFMLNCFINLSAVYMMTFADIFKFDLIIDSLKSGDKPFFSLLVRTFIKYGQLSLTTLTTVYFIAYGARIVELLDSRCFRIPLYCSKTQASLVAFAVVLANGLLLVTMYFKHLLEFISAPISFGSVLSILTLYFIASNMYFPCNLLLYQQYATKKVLTQMAVALEQRKTGKFSLTQLLCKLQDLAIANNNLYDLLSFPLTIFIFLHLETVIIVFNLIIYLYQEHGPSSLLFGIIPCASWLYIGYLTRLNHQIKALFDRISDTLTDLNQEEGELEVSHLKQALILQSRQSMLLGKGGTTVTHTVQNHSGASHHLLTHLSTGGVQKARIQSRAEESGTGKKICQVRLHEIELYRPYFEIRLYYLVRVNMAFMLHAGLFALSYFVFIQQTK